MDANAGPGTCRALLPEAIGPHGVPFPRDPAKDPACQAFLTFCKDAGLRIGHTWFQHPVRFKHSFNPNAANLDSPRDLDHVLIDERSFACLEDVKSHPGLVISTSEALTADGAVPGHRAAVVRPGEAAEG